MSMTNSSIENFLTDLRSSLPAPGGGGASALCGAVICQGALKGAAVNVKVNTSLMKDKVYADEISEQVTSMMDEYLARAEAIFESIYGRYE